MIAMIIIVFIYDFLISKIYFQIIHFYLFFISNSHLISGVEVEKSFSKKLEF